MTCTYMLLTGCGDRGLIKALAVSQLLDSGRDVSPQDGIGSSSPYPKVVPIAFVTALVSVLTDRMLCSDHQTLHQAEATDAAGVDVVRACTATIGHIPHRPCMGFRTITRLRASWVSDGLTRGRRRACHSCDYALDPSCGFRSN